MIQKIVLCPKDKVTLSFSDGSYISVWSSSDLVLNSDGNTINISKPDIPESA